MNLLIKNGHIIDPANGRDGVSDILIKHGKISNVAKNISKKTNKVIDAKNRIISPGLIDMHVHLREPGREDIETVASGTRAALSGGITSVACMPNTYPPIDNCGEARRLKDIIKRDAACSVFIVGAITKERSGVEITDIKAMKEEGIIALSDDGAAVQNGSIMLRALKKAAENDILVIAHCENKNISKNGVVNEGIIATKLGLRGIPRKAEYEFVERDIGLAGEAKARIHIAHVSTRESVEIIRKAKKDGIPVTAEAAPHHFSMKENACETYDTRTKMNPPLRSIEDVEAIKEGLKDGTIDTIASDHAPHGKHEKEITFDLAAFGIIGLETSLGLAIINLVDKKIISWQKLIELMSVNPAGILGLKRKGNLSVGSDADITIIDPEKEWIYTRDSIRSESKNSPFINQRFKGKVTHAIVGGEISYAAI